MKIINIIKRIHKRHILETLNLTKKIIFDKVSLKLGATKAFKKLDLIVDNKLSSNRVQMYVLLNQLITVCYIEHEYNLTNISKKLETIGEQTKEYITKSSVLPNQMFSVKSVSLINYLTVEKQINDKGQDIYIFSLFEKDDSQIDIICNSKEEVYYLYSILYWYYNLDLEIQAMPTKLTYIKYFAINNLNQATLVELIRELEKEKLITQRNVVYDDSFKVETIEIKFNIEKLTNHTHTCSNLVKKITHKLTLKELFQFQLF
jgi:hypothetical protein